MGRQCLEPGNDLVADGPGRIHAGVATEGQDPGDEGVALARRDVDLDPTFLASLQHLGAGDIPDRPPGDLRTEGHPRPSRRLPQSPRARLQQGGGVESIRGRGRWSDLLHRREEAREPEGPNLTSGSIQSSQVPVTAPKHQRVGVHFSESGFALRGAVPKPNRPPPGQRIGHGAQMWSGRVRSGGGGSFGHGRQDVGLCAGGELLECKLGIAALPRSMGRHEQGPYLVGGEADLGQVVLVLGDAVALLHFPGVGRGQLYGYAHFPEGVLVPLEHPLGRHQVLKRIVGGFHPQPPAGPGGDDNAPHGGSLDTDAARDRPGRGGRATGGRRADGRRRWRPGQSGGLPRAGWAGCSGGSCGAQHDGRVARPGHRRRSFRSGRGGVRRNRGGRARANHEAPLHPPSGNGPDGRGRGKPAPSDHGGRFRAERTPRGLGAPSLDGGPSRGRRAGRRRLQGRLRHDRRGSPAGRALPPGRRASGGRPGFERDHHRPGVRWRPRGRDRILGAPGGAPRGGSRRAGGERRARERWHRNFLGRLRRAVRHDPQRRGDPGGAAGGRAQGELRRSQRKAPGRVPSLHHCSVQGGPGSGPRRGACAGRGSAAPDDLGFVAGGAPGGTPSAGRNDRTARARPARRLRPRTPGDGARGRRRPRVLAGRGGSWGVGRPHGCWGPRVAGRRLETVTGGSGALPGPPAPRNAIDHRTGKARSSGTRAVVTLATLSVLTTGLIALLVHPFDPDRACCDHLFYRSMSYNLFKVTRPDLNVSPPGNPLPGLYGTSRFRSLSPLNGLNRQPPYVFRIVTPLLARSVAYAPGIDAAYYLISFLALAGAALFIGLSIFKLTGSEIPAMAGAVLFLVHPYSARFNLQRFMLTDPLAFFLTALAIWALVERKRMLFFASCALGVLNKESMVLLLIAYW